MINVDCLRPSNGEACHKRQDHQSVGIVDAEILMAHPGADEVDRQQRRNRQTERQLQSLPQRDTQMTPLVKRPKRQTKMRQQRTIQRGRADRIAPQSEKPDAVPSIASREIKPSEWLSKWVDK